MSADPEYRGEFYIESYSPVVETGKAVMFTATQDTLFATATSQASLEDWVVDNPFNNTENQSSSTQQNSGDSNPDSGSGLGMPPFSITVNSVEPTMMVDDDPLSPSNGNGITSNAWNWNNLNANASWDVDEGQGQIAQPAACR